MSSAAWEENLDKIYDLIHYDSDVIKGTALCPGEDQIASDVIDAVKKEVGEKETALLLDTWGKLDGVRISLYPKTGEDLWFRAECSVPALEEFGKSEFRIFDGNEWVTQSESEYFGEGYWVLDEISNSIHVIIKFGPDSPTLFLKQFDEEPRELSLDLEAYFSKAIEYCGLFFWQSRYLVREDSFEKSYSPDFLSENLQFLGKEGLEMELPACESSKESTPLSKVFFSSEKRNFYTLLNDRKSKMESNGAKFSEFRNLDQISTCATPAAFRKAEHYLKRFLTAELYELYMFLNGFEMRWEHPDSGMKGAARVLPVEEMIGGPNGVGKRVWDDTAFKDWLWFDDTGEPVKEFVKPLKVFFEFEGESREIVIDFRPETPECFILSKFERSGRTASPKEVIDMLFDSMGRQGWEQYVFGEGFPDAEKDAFVQEVRDLWE